MNLKLLGLLPFFLVIATIYHISKSDNAEERMTIFLRFVFITMIVFGMWLVTS